MKDAYYFSHDANAHNDPKMLNLRLLSGWEGIGLFWTFLEILREIPEHKYAEENHLASLELRLSTPQAKLQAWLKDCYKVGLLVCEDGFIYSVSFLDRMREMDEKRQLLSEAGRRGGLASSQAKASLKAGSSSKVKESKVKEIEASFLEFYSKYPRKQGKEDAFKAFQKLDPKDALLERLLSAVSAWASSEAWLKDGGKYVPLPATWLRGKRWEDELPKGANPYASLRKITM